MEKKPPAKSVGKLIAAHSKPPKEKPTVAGRIRLRKATPPPPPPKKPPTNVLALIARLKGKP